MYLIIVCHARLCYSALHSIYHRRALLEIQMTGCSTTPFPNLAPAAQTLRAMGGDTLYSTLDKPAAGIATEVAFLTAAVDAGDWAH